MPFAIFQNCFNSSNILKWHLWWLYQKSYECEFISWFMATIDVFKDLKIAWALGKCNLRILKTSRVTIIMKFLSKFIFTFFIYNLLNKITPLLCFHSKFHIAPITYSIYAFVIDQSQTWYSVEYTIKSNITTNQAITPTKTMLGIETVVLRMKHYCLPLLMAIKFYQVSSSTYIIEEQCGNDNLQLVTRHLHCEQTIYWTYTCMTSLWIYSIT